MASSTKSDINEKAVKEIMSTEVAKSLNMEVEYRDEPAIVAAVTNNRGQTLQLLATKNWTGNFFEGPPASVGAGVKVQFSHKGSKGALIYGQPQGASNAAAYLLAWSFGNGPYRVRTYSIITSVSPYSRKIIIKTLEMVLESAIKF
ncbi:hypothetical protein RND81_09G252300 [Saponaria officinalis]|uniref:Uncharacterized protein n=1 Tax=Saponaria officinalis TaxID=3572 RepID=A0AAW1IRB2_SAPOF